jgi:hypothetical protein
MCERWDFCRGFSTKGTRHRKRSNITRNFRGLNEKQRVIFFVDTMADRSSTARGLGGMQNGERRSRGS